MRRYDRELSLEIDRTVERFNNKIKRLEKLDNKVILPEKITRADIVTSTSRKSSIKKKLKDYQKFLTRGAEDIITTNKGAKITKYEMEQLKSRQRTAKTRLTKGINRLQNKKIKIAGVEQAGTFQSMGDSLYYTMVAQRTALDKDLNNLNKDELKRFNKMVNRYIHKGDSDFVFKENYLDILEKTAYSYGIDKRQFDEINKRIKQLSPSQFVNLFNEDKAIQALLDQYSQMKMAMKDTQQTVDDLYELLVNNLDEILEDYE